MSLPQPLARVRHPLLAVVLTIGAAILVLAGVMALGQFGSPVLRFRVGVVGYLFVLVGGAGYIALSVGHSLGGV